MINTRRPRLLRSSSGRQLLSYTLLLCSIGAPMALAANSTGAETVTTATKSTAVPRPASWANPVAVSGNLYRVTPLLYRSARLQTGDVTLLQSLGIKTVVSLRAFHSDSQLLAGSGIRLQRIGIHTWDIDDREVILALRAITAGMKQGPVLLHCLHGADRTGLITAMYRMLYQGWSKEKALDELINGGYGYHSMWKNIPVYIRQVDLEKIRTAVEKP